MIVPPLLDRLYTMFAAQSTDQKDPLRNVLFDYTTAFIKGKKFNSLKISEDAREFFEEFLQYVERDRPLQCNDGIEAELNNENLKNFDAYLETQDLHCMTNIIKYRKYIFANYEN